MKIIPIYIKTSNYLMRFYRSVPLEFAHKTKIQMFFS